MYTITYAYALVLYRDGIDGTKTNVVELTTQSDEVKLARLYPKLRTRLSLSSKNPGFLANTFSMSLIFDSVQKLKLPLCNGFSVWFWFL